MWNKLSQAAGLTVESENEKEEKMSQAIDEDRFQHQELLIQQLKDLVRENEKRFQDKSKEYDDLTSKFQKFKLQTKAKISHLSSQIKEQEKPGKKEDCDFDDTSSSDSSDQFQRGKVLLLKKQLNQAKHQLEKKEEESKKLVELYDKKISDLNLQLNEKNLLISSFADAESKDKLSDVKANDSPKKESGLQEMYAQIVYKDTKIMDLNNQILELEKKIIDLQEHVKEKDEVLQQRNRAVQLMAEDLNRKGQTVVDELGDTKEQMKIMQENFSSTENEWKQDLEKYKKRISELENDVMELSKKAKENEICLKNLETARSELITKNADLQKKIVVVQESASRQCEVYNKEIGEEVESLKKSLESERQRATELQKALDESNSQSNNKVLKARVNERTKFKALERELNELKKEHEKKPQEIIELQQKIAELEEEKGSLQLKLMEIEDQVAQSDKLKEENKALKITCEENLKQIQTYEEKIKNLLEENEKWEIKFNVLNDSYKEIEEKCNFSNEENNKLQEKNKELFSVKEKVEYKNNKLENELSNVKKMYEESMLNMQMLRDQKVAFEMRIIELEEIRENDDKAKKELLIRIQQLEESFRDESKPDIQLERENLELKDKLRELEIYCGEIKQKDDSLLIQIDTLQKQLSCDEKNYSLQIENLNNSIVNLEEARNTLMDNLNSKSEENAEQAKLMKELENSFSCLKTDFSNVLSYFDAKDINDCKNYAIQRAEEYSLLKNDYEKVIKDKDSLLLLLNEKEEEIKKYFSRIEELTLHHQSELQGHLETIENLKHDNAVKASSLSKLMSEIQEKDASIEASSQVLLEKSEVILQLEEHTRTLIRDLDTSKEAFSAFKEKVASNNSSLLGQISDMESEIDSVRGELSSKTHLVDSLENNLQSVKNENLVLKEKLHDTQNVIEENCFKIKDLGSVIEDLKKSLLSKDEENRALMDTVDIKIAEISSMTQKIDQYANEMQTKNEEALKLAQDFQQTNEIIAALEESSRILKEKNTILENEKLHSNRSLSEKDEVYQQVLSENVHLKSEVNRIYEENSSLIESFKETNDKLILLNLTIDKIKSLTEADELEVQEFCSQESKNYLEYFIKEYFKLKSVSQTAIKSLTGENSGMKNEIAALKSTIESYEQELKNSTLTIDKLKKECEESSEKASSFQNDLVASNDLRLLLETKSNELESEIIKMREENSSLCGKIESLDKDHSLLVSSLRNDLASNESSLKTTIDKLKALENEKYELEISLKSSSDSQASELEMLNEKFINLGKEFSEKDKLIINYEKEINILKNQLEENKLKFLDEEAALKNALEDNTLLKNSLSDLDTKLKVFESVNISNENATTNLQSSLSLKDSEIHDLKLLVNKLKDEVKNTQIALEEDNKLREYVESKIKSLMVCKQYFLMILRTLINSYQFDCDISVFEVDDVNEQSLKEFVQQSKITDIISTHASEEQSLTKLCNELKDKLMSLKASNSELLSECTALKTTITQTVENNFKQQDIKLESLFSAFEDKDSRITNLKSKIFLLSDFFQMQKNQVVSLHTEKDHLSNQLEIIKKTVIKSEQTIQTLNKEKETMGNNLLSVSELHEVRILELEAENKELVSKTKSFQKELKQNQTTIDAYILEIQELQTLMQAKDRDIFGIGEELQAKSNRINSLTLDLEKAHSSIQSLQNEVRQLNRQVQKHTAEAQVLETADNVSNGLQVEVEVLKNQLAFSEEQKLSLQQHIDNTDAQLQSLLSEKLGIESKLRDMELKIVDLTECNVNLSNTVEELNSVVLAYEQKSAETRNHEIFYEETLNEMKLNSEKLNQELAEKEKLLNEIENFKNDKNKVINVLSRVQYLFTEAENTDDDTASFIAEFNDECLISTFSEFLRKLVEAKKLFENEKRMLQNTVEILNLESGKIKETLGKPTGETDTSDTNIEKICVVPTQTPIQTCEEILCKQESAPLASIDIENENKSLKQDLIESKTKFSKSLEKLKLFKIKTDKLSNELKDVKAKNSTLESLVSQNESREKELLDQLTVLNDEKGSLLSKFESLNDQSILEQYKETVQKLKQQNSLLEEKLFKAKQELEEYMHSWKELNVSYELQKEDVKNLRSSVRKLSEQLDASNSKISDLSSKLTQIEMENFHFKQEAENLKEHANMLLSDNDTYQTLIEKLKAAKSLSELKLLEAKEQFSAELEALKVEHRHQLENIEPKEVENVSLIAEECTSLKQMCSELQQLNKIIQNERDTYFRNQTLLEKEKVYLQQQLLEKNTELQKVTSKLDNIAPFPSYSDKEEDRCMVEISRLKEENENLKSHYSNLNQELNVCKENFSYLQNDSSSRESFYVDKINSLETQLKQLSETKQIETMDITFARNTESELSQVLSSLHKQGLQCEELKTEVTKLLEERNMLRLQLQQSHHSNTGVKSEFDRPDVSSDLISVKVESPSSSEVSTLHARLKECEKACQQLRQDNDALDRALNIERDQKRLIEEELNYAKEHLSEEAKASDEYQILIGDINEPEMLAETNFLISRNVRTHAYKLRRWLRGRKNYLCRTVKSRNYSQLGYMFYLLFIHIWLLMCAFS